MEYQLFTAVVRAGDVLRKSKLKLGKNHNNTINLGYHKTK